MRKIFPILAIAFSLPFFALAADSVNIENPLVAADFEGVVGKIIDFLFKIAVVLAPLMIVIGGALFVTSGGDLQKTEQAKRLMLWTAVGFLIIIMAKGFISLVKEILGA